MCKIKLSTLWASCLFCLCSAHEPTCTEVASIYKASTAEGDVDSLLQLETPLLIASSREQKTKGTPTSPQGSEDDTKRAAAHVAAGRSSLLDEQPGPNLLKASMIIISLFFAFAALDVLAHEADQYIEDPQKRLIVDHSVDGIAASLCLMISFIWYVLVQESVLQQKYPSGELFPDAAFLVFFDRLFMVIVAGVALLISGTQIQWEALKWTVGPGILEYVGVYLQFKSMLFLTMPVVSLFRCTTVIPTMIGNTLINGEKFGFRDYALAVLMIAGVAGFQAFNRKDHSALKEGAVVGITLMIAGLIGQSFSFTTGKWIFRRYRRFGQLQMMLGSSCVGGVIGGVACQFTVGFSVFFKFISRNPEAVQHMAILSIAHSLGVYFIFYLIDHQGPVALVIAMLVKQVLSIYISAILFHHEITAASSACAAVTFLAVLARPCLKYFLDSNVEVPLKVGKLRNLLRFTAAIRRRLGQQVKTSATVFLAVARLKAGLVKKDEDKDTQLREYKMAFDMVDKDGSGRIDKKELRGVLDALGQKHTGQEVEIMMSKFTSEKDYINFDDFVSFLKTVQQKQSEEDLVEAFEVFDEDSSGNIRIREFLQVFSSLGENVSREEMIKMIAEHDINEDGKLNLEEFIGMMRK